jgi:hypothetical protein
MKARSGSGISASRGSAEKWKKRGLVPEGAVREVDAAKAFYQADRAVVATNRAPGAVPAPMANTEPMVVTATARRAGVRTSSSLKIPRLGRTLRSDAISLGVLGKCAAHLVAPAPNAGSSSGAVFDARQNASARRVRRTPPRRPTQTLRR